MFENRPVDIGWHGGGKCHPWATGYQHFATSEKFFRSFCCCLIFVAKEISPEILVELNLIFVAY